MRTATYAKGSTTYDIDYYIDQEPVTVSSWHKVWACCFFRMDITLHFIAPPADGLGVGVGSSGANRRHKRTRQMLARSPHSASTPKPFTGKETQSRPSNGSGSTHGNLKLDIENIRSTWRRKVGYFLLGVQQQLNLWDYCVDGNLWTFQRLHCRG
jgi:hypothetical protein